MAMPPPRQVAGFSASYEPNIASCRYRWPLLSIGVSLGHSSPTDDQVEFVMEKPKGAKFDVGGVLYDKVRLTMVLDGYTAPVTAGTIVDLIQRGERRGCCRL